MAEPMTEEAEGASLGICDICKAEYSSEKSPKLLPCLHTCCGPCLQARKGRVLEGERILCPKCDTKFAVGEVIENLYLMERLKQSAKSKNQEKVDKVPKCTACEEDKDAAAFCTECSDWLCEQCVQAHKRVRVTKDHIIKSRETTLASKSVNDNNTVNQRFMNCKLHSQEQLKLYCQTCDKLTCRDCQLQEHKDHQYQFVHEASSHSKDILTKVMDSMKEKRKSIINAKQLITERQQEIHAKEKIVAKEISSTIKNVIEEFNKYGQALLTDLQVVSREKIQQLAKRNEEVARLASKLDQCLNFLQDILDNGTNLSILHTQGILKRQIESVLKARCEVPNPNHIVDIRYSHNSAYFRQKMIHLGLLFVDGVPLHADRAAPSQDKFNDTQHGQQPQGVHNYLQDLQRLTPEQKQAVLQRMIQLQRSKTVQNSGPNSATSLTGPPGASNRMEQHSTGQTASGPIPVGRPVPPLVPRPRTPGNGPFIVPPGDQQMRNGSPFQPSRGPSHLQQLNPPNRYWRWHVYGPTGQGVPEGTASQGTFNHSQASHSDSFLGESTRSALSDASELHNVSVKQEKDGLEGGPMDLGEKSTASLETSGNHLGPPMHSLIEDGVGLAGHVGNTGLTNRLAQPIPAKQIDSTDPSEDYCACCHNGGELLCCDFCPKVFHFQCHIPVVTVAPSGSWMCTLSLDPKEIRMEKTETREISQNKQMRKTPVGLTKKELQACERILLELFSHEASTPFHEPVSKSVPEYYKIITSPMDFSTIKCKLSKQNFNHYSTVLDFLTDIKLVFTNCAKYNAKPSEVGRAGNTVRLFFEQLVDRFLPYYVPFVEEDHSQDSPGLPALLSTPQALHGQHNSQVPVSADSEQAKGTKRRKMEKQSVIPFM